MANETLHGADAISAAAADDELWVWQVSTGLLKKITAANLKGGVLTGGGVLATGGFTLTVPATGTAALLGTAQTFTAQPTFNAGVKFASGDALTLYDEGTWTPAITGSGSNPTVTYTSQLAEYTRIGDRVLYNFNVTIATISGGSGDVRISLPSTAYAFAHYIAAAYLSGVDLPAATTSLAFAALSGSAYGTYYAFHDDSNAERLQISSLAAGDILMACGEYRAAA